ncbi:carbamoyltransferase HypF [Nitriliruptor alkaliphilus]|uniref:carbamoyltransferase HypF n=1 Tax=Nitriliruptor alkaliphilus TaxID=427918 RepID=UPI0006972CE9|nr:carbamoyltransferase HypF [Nitriliruptor alkaliphilus]
MTAAAPIDATTGARTAPIRRVRLTVTGTVQGVGFRPHVHRLATELGLAGLVGNDSAGVHIEVEGGPATVRRFEQRLRAEAPPLAHVADVVAVEVPVQGATRFTIAASQHADGPVTTAPPDTAACADCLAEVADPADRRFRYPFTTCTNCGPRFTIITSLPYDRPATTMAGFPLCIPCDAEYHDPADRRFHAQPVACVDCGPRIWLEGPAVADGGGSGSSDEVLLATQRLLADGAIVAVKGVGGFHLACRADEGEVVAMLRRRKQRPGKPFALLARDLDVAGRLAHIDDTEAAVLTSPAAPIVLLRRRADAPLADAVAPGNPLVGIMLPASPLHHLLLGDVPGSDVAAQDVLVMTSGNLSEEPLCTEDDEARERLAAIADAYLLHDRPIAVPCDDSVVRVDTVGGRAATTVLRRSRGYVPTPVPLPFEGVPALAVGGHLKVTAGLTDGRRAWLSAHIGDMGTLPTLRAFERTVDRFATMHEVAPRRLIVDAHPDYTTHRWATRHADGRAVVEVQHHHAHVAAVMAEHGIASGTPVLGFAFDGTGYGPDGTIWGGEILLADYAGFERLAHLSTVALPGGDAAIGHPHRVALSHLRSAGVGWDERLPAVAHTSLDERRLLAAQLDRDFRCVPTSSVGRLFDAVASLIGVRHEITFEAQAAIELEVLAGEAEGAWHPLDLPLVEVSDGPDQLDSGTLVRGVVAAVLDGVAPAAVALGFHRALAEAVCATAAVVRDRGGPHLVALSGGVFANALLTDLATTALARAGFTVLRHQLVPPNDGGLALGQIAVGAHHSRS